MINNCKTWRFSVAPIIILKKSISWKISFIFTQLVIWFSIIINSQVLFNNHQSFFILFQGYYLEWIILFSSFLCYKYIGVKGFWLINVLGSSIFLINLLSAFNHIVYYNQQTTQILPLWGKFNHLVEINFCIFIDYISYNFSALTAIIALTAYAYSIVYMRFETNIIYFIFLLKLFVLSMITLVWAGNWITFIFGWEMIGISSFLLINFWVNKITTLKSAFKAFTFNKFSDVCLIIGFLLILNINGMFFTTYFYNLNLLTYNYLSIMNFKCNLIDVIIVFLILCSFCKSAQFGFHFWLPDSMEAPVPASALIHSATLVSAGIYLLLRYNILIQYSNIGWYIILLTSSFTSFYGAIIAAFQTDGKKILAYSTISHCGFLMVSILLYNPIITLLYLIGHGIFKSASFMCIGNLIQINGNYQDSRVWGGHHTYLIAEFFLLTFCIINLSGLPFTINFFTKHFLLFSYNYSSNTLLGAYIFIKFAAYSGIFYSLKIIFNSFFLAKKSFFKNYQLINWAFNDYLIFKKFFKSNKLFLLFLLSLIGIGLTLITWYILVVFNQNGFSLDTYNNFPIIHKNMFFNILINYFFIIIFYEFFMNFFFFKTVNRFNINLIIIIFFLLNYII